MPSKWLAGLWGDEEPVFDGDEQIKAVLGANGKSRGDCQTLTPHVVGRTLLRLSRKALVSLGRQVRRTAFLCAWPQRIH